MDFFGIELEQPQAVRVEVRGGDITWLARGAAPQGDRAEPDRPDGDETPELCAEIAFGDPSNEVVDPAITALDLWAELVVFGGYAPLEVTPRESGGDTARRHPLRRVHGDAGVR